MTVADLASRADLYSGDRETESWIQDRALGKAAGGRDEHSGNAEIRSLDADQFVVAFARDRNIADAVGAKRGIVEWSASGVIAGDLFPELWNAVVTTDWPAFVVNEPCNPPADTGDDFSLPACTGKLIEPVLPTGTHCDMPSSVSEDFSGATCDGAPLSVVPKQEKQSPAKAGKPKKGSAGNKANVVEIELVLRLARVNPAPQSRPPSTNDPTAHNVGDKSRHSGPA
jgi:hypothetical protein